MEATGEHSWEMSYHTLDSTEYSTVWKNNTDSLGCVRNQTAIAKFYEYLIQFICLYFPFHVGSRVIYEENLYLYMSDKVFYLSLMIAFIFCFTSEDILESIT